MTCDARFGWTHPELTLVLTCELPLNHPELEHQAVWEHDLNEDMPTTTVHWLDNDRRSFRGEWRQCSEHIRVTRRHRAPCCLPAGHQGNHAP